MKPAFIINNRNKGRHVYRAVKGALQQLEPCEIIISDQHSEDHSLSEIRRALREVQPAAAHDVRVLHCPIEGPSCMETGNRHFQWAARQTGAEWVYQCSADDFSLPARVQVCEAARRANPCVAVATSMFFTGPGEEPREGADHGVTAHLDGDGYVAAAEGVEKLIFGSVIAGYSRQFLDRAGHGGKNTIDVLFGYLAAVTGGFYAVATPTHCHVQHASPDNMGFCGKLRAASGDERLRLEELNFFQLFRLYRDCALEGERLLGGPVPQAALAPIVQMLVSNGVNWCAAREALHDAGVLPGVMP